MCMMSCSATLLGLSGGKVIVYVHNACMTTTSRSIQYLDRTADVCVLLPALSFTTNQMPMISVRGKRNTLAVPLFLAVQEI
jgi:hypothetical protein